MSLSFLCVSAILSCVREEAIITKDNAMVSLKSPVKTRSVESDGYEHLENPYSLGVMQYVYDTYSTMNVKQLEPTDIYLRIQPKDSSQLKYLLYESGLDIFEYPLDIELGDDEDYYDQSLSTDEFPWLYVVVKPDYELSSELKYEVLDLCYIPGDGESIAQTRSESVDVEDAAYMALGYDVDGTTGEKPMGSGKSYPKGRITVYDDSNAKEVPVKGVKVRGHKFVKYSIGYTDENGYYELRSRFKNKLHYAIVFDNIKGFDIWGNFGPFARAHCSIGKHSSDSCSKRITKEHDPKLWRWSAVNNAGYDYYKMCEETGIKEPPGSLKIMTLRSAESSSTPMMRHINVENSMWLSFFKASGLAFVDAYTNRIIFDMCFPDITIGTDKKNYARIYQHTAHELAHASHFSQVGKTYWGKYIDYVVNRFGYGNGKGLYAELCGISEMWGYMMEYAQYYDCYEKDALPENFPAKDWVDWFKPQVFWQLYQQKTLTKRQIFDCLTNDIYSFDNLASLMYSKYPESAEKIAEAFEKYGIELNVRRNLTLRDQSVTASMILSGETVSAENVTVTGGAELVLSGRLVTIRSPFLVDEESSVILQNS